MTALARARSRLDKFNRKVGDRLLGSFQADCFIGNRNLDTKLVCLIIGARHERRSADARRKPEVFLDTARGAGLAAARPAVEYQRGQSFRAGMDCCGEARRPGADNRHVVRVGRIDRAHEAETARQVIFVRIVRDSPYGQTTTGRRSRSKQRRSTRALASASAPDAAIPLMMSWRHHRHFCRPYRSERRAENF
jgi:hypothetical protein